MTVLGKCSMRVRASDHPVGFPETLSFAHCLLKRPSPTYLLPQSFLLLGKVERKLVFLGRGRGGLGLGQAGRPRTGILMSGCIWEADRPVAAEVKPQRLPGAGASTKKRKSLKSTHLNCVGACGLCPAPLSVVGKGGAGCCWDCGVLAFTARASQVGGFLWTCARRLSQGQRQPRPWALAETWPDSK